MFVIIIRNIIFSTFNTNKIFLKLKYIFFLFLFIIFMEIKNVIVKLIFYI